MRGTALAVGFFAFGFSLLIVVPVFNAVLPTRVRPFKGGYFTPLPWDTLAGGPLKGEGGG